MRYIPLLSFLFLLLCPAWSQPIDTIAPGQTPGIDIPIKPDTKAKRILSQPVYNPDAPPPSKVPHLPQGWHLLQKQDSRTTLLIHGKYEQMRRPGGLGPENFLPVNPPKFQAMLGLSTVQTIDKAGWTMAAGPRFMVKTTDKRANYATRSYASWASVGWGAAIRSGDPPATRMFLESRQDAHSSFGQVLDKIIDNAPASGIWVISAQALFPSITGQSLRRAPVGESLNDFQDPEIAARSHFMPIRQLGRSGLITAIAIDPTHPHIPQPLQDFLPQELNTTPAGRRYIAHYALFREPAPGFNPGQSFQAIWNPEFLWKQSEPNKKPRVPAIETVRRLLPQQTSIVRAHINAWAISATENWPQPEKPDLVDPTTLDSSILVDHQWTRENPLFEARLFKKGRILLRRSAAEALVRVNKRLYEQGYRLKIFEGYRPFWITQMLWSRHRAAAYLAAPSVGSRHNRASAVDCTIVTLDGREVKMPSPSLAFDASSHRDYDKMDPEVRENILILTRAMQDEGWGIIYSEWWHFDAPDWQQYDILNIPLWPDREHLAIENVARKSMLLPPGLEEDGNSEIENTYQAPPVPQFPGIDQAPETIKIAQAATTPTRRIAPPRPALPPSSTTLPLQSAPSTQTRKTHHTLRANITPTPTVTPISPPPPKVNPAGKMPTGRILVYLGLGLVLTGLVLLAFTGGKH